VGATAFCRGQLAGVRSNPLGEYGEIPIAIQDRSFNQDGSLFYPDSREFFDGYAGPYIPETHLAPIWNPEFFGNMMVVNGRAWPYLNVQRKRYRFRLLNGCNSRFLVLKLTKTPRTADDVFNTVDGDIWQIGADGGFLPKAAQQSALLMAPAERADVIIDFAQFNVGDEVYLVNDGPDAPFGGISTTDLANWESTGQVMKFIVKSGPAMDRSTHPSKLRLPFVRNLRTGANPVLQALTLNEHVHDAGSAGEVPAAALLGRLLPDGTSQTQGWADPDHRESRRGGGSTLVLDQSHRGRPPDPPAPGSIPSGGAAALQRWDQHCRAEYAAPGRNRVQGHRHCLPGGGHRRQGQVRHPRALRVALSHRRARG